MYKLYVTTLNQNGVIRYNEDGSSMSFILGTNSSEEQAYLAWLAEGNEPLLAENT